MLSDCCGAMVVMGDICSRCREHCGDVFEMDGVECGREDGFEDSDDGYDAARDAYNMGYGQPVTERQRQDLKDEMDSRRYGWY